MNLESQHVVLLGGSSGIGLATAHAAAAAGATVTVVSRRESAVAKALAELPVGATGHAVDLTDAPAVHTLFETLGPIDHLVYTAGEPLTLMPFGRLDAERARQAFGLRYFALLTVLPAAVPRLRPGGSITLTSGVAGDRPGPGWAVAAGICAAVDALTRALAVELAPSVRVNAVKPGVVRSPLWDSLPEADREQLYATVGGSIPLGRVGEVEEIARTYLYCLSQPFSTGSIITVDGGSVLS